MASMEADVQGNDAGRSNFCFRKKTFACLCVATLFTFIGVCLTYLRDEHKPIPLFRAPKRAVTLLIWAHPFGNRDIPDCSALYKIDGCRITDDRSEYARADAVVFHHREIGAGSVQLPSEPRPSAQKWIWMNFESPSHSPRLGSFEGVFNLTMSYRKDSSIFIPSGSVIPVGREVTGVAQPLSTPSDSELSRPHFVAWVVSNWSQNQARVILYNKLRQYIDVDVFGHGHRPLPPESGNNVVQLVRQYLFYLAMENSQHTDYMTEKLWNSIEAGAVPVVLGPSRKNYERFLPPEAFIHVDDFPTVEELARYLQTLRVNPHRLKKHLDWRKGYSMHRVAPWSEHYCTACKVVRSSLGKTDVVQNLGEWYKS
ncbi:alpha-(1,3)-fucosyltransferase 4-like [Betta splendens]|uniref:Fucosyltransferase n=1 Tax=Betta splendens TaxID=158456 RepID=A0A6P7PDK3_BETSP|nr:alpha-(1,3)-fucosyltransferase 4-like [Betta splendens]